MLLPLETELLRYAGDEPRGNDGALGEGAALLRIDTGHNGVVPPEGRDASPDRLVASTDFLATLMAGVVASAASCEHLEILEAPLDLRSVPFVLAWHRRNDSHPAQRWLGGAIAEVAEYMPAAGKRRSSGRRECVGAESKRPIRRVDAPERTPRVSRDRAGPRWCARGTVAARRARVCQRAPAVENERL